MRGQLGLLWEALSRPEVRSEIIEIAWQEAEKRRVAEEEIARKRGKQQSLDGIVAMCRGYAVYTDFEEYLKQRMLREGLKLSNWDIPNIKIKIRGILCEDGWEHEPSRGRKKARFYPPGTESPNLGRRLKGDTLSYFNFLNTITNTAATIPKVIASAISNSVITNLSLVQKILFDLSSNIA